MRQFKRTTGKLLRAAGLCSLALLHGPATRAQQAPGLVQQDLAAADPAIAAGLAPYLQARSARFIDWLADGSVLLATRFGDTEQVHRVRTPLGMREQLSFDAGGVLGAAAQPAQNDSFVYLAARAGGQSTALLLQRAGQLPQPLTEGTFADGPALWAHDGRRIAFSSHRGGGAGASGPAREREVYLLETGSTPPTPARLVAGGAGYRWRALDFAPDDQRLLLARESVSAEGEPVADSGAGPELFIADLGSGELSPVAPHAGDSDAKSRGRLKAEPRSEATPASQPIRARRARFAPDGRGLLLLASGEASGGTGTGSAGSAGAAADFWQLRYLDPGGETRVLSIASGHDVELFDESADGHYLAYTVNEAGASRLALIDQQRKLDLSVPAVPPGLITSLKFDSSGHHLALTLESTRAPADVYVLEPETETLTRWTQSEPGPIDGSGFVVPTLVRFPTWDRVESGQPRMLSAYAYRPAPATALSAPATPAAGTPVAGTAAPSPVLILLRSGAGEQFRPGFDPFLQYLVRELGFVVLAPNVRGSGGFGRSFADLAQGPTRDDAARDIGSLLVWIGLQHELDFNHILIMGEGNGSYLALACLGQYGDRLRGGIIAFPPHLGSLSHATSIRRPVLLVHGRNDPEAPAYEAEQLAARLRTGGAAVQYLAAGDEGARFRHRSNRDAYYAAAANFLAQLTR